MADVGGEVEDIESAPDPVLDDLEAAFDTVDAALKALDADDLDGAEALAASLGESAGEPADLPPSTET